MKADLALVSMDERHDGVVEVRVEIQIEADRDEKPRAVVEDHIPGVVNTDTRVRLPDVPPARQALRNLLDQLLGVSRLYMPEAAILSNPTALLAFRGNLAGAVPCVVSMTGRLLLDLRDARGSDNDPTRAHGVSGRRPYPG